MAADIEHYVAMAEAVLADGDAERALGIYEQVAEMAPDNLAVVAGRAQALLAALPEDKAKDPALAQVKAAVALARETAPVDDLTPLRQAVEANPQDLDARYELAGGLMAAGDRDGAADQLLASIAQDRAYKEGAARERLLKLFASIGLEDPWVAAQRRRLSTVLFG